MSFFLFYTLAILTGLCAIAMVVSQNIVRAAAWLLFTLAGISGIFFLLGAEFVGATQLLVYVGGTLVLVVFGVMLTAQGPFVSMKTSAAEWLISVAVGLIFFGVLVVSIVHPKSQTAFAQRPKVGVEMTTAEQLGMSLVNMTKATPEGLVTGTPEYEQWLKYKQDPTAFKQEPHVQKRRRIAYLLPFEIVSVHLVVVLIGAAYLARTKRRRVKPTPESEGTTS